ncbi:serine/threonine-protein kinase [Actinocatenispora thailandica]|uniref:serine/threonine-protein kinase n=1 Tax=Actinocatenispora thailandica TaxID=227318 RepID=UPI0019501936|nr:serine/threonine-protein kinase [Actinocatenispora thailandica]
MQSVRADTVLNGRYRLRRRLGAGGMSVVWQAYDRVLERPVAIKLLTGATPDTERVRAEARAVARLTHPHIVNVFDCAEATGPDGTVLPFVVMEYVPGRSLAARLDDGPLPWPAAVTVAAEVADALAAAHARGIVHRDVTAANVLLAEAGAKVVDFGISAAIGDRDAPPGENSILGTPAYLSPERLAGLPVEPSSDVYSLGVLLHVLLTGETPFGGDTTTDATQAHWYGPPAALPPIAGLPAEVDRLRRRCLAKRAKDRPTAAHLAAELHALAPVAEGSATDLRAPAATAEPRAAEVVALAATADPRAAGVLDPGMAPGGPATDVVDADATVEGHAGAASVAPAGRAAAGEDDPPGVDRAPAAGARYEPRRGLGTAGRRVALAAAVVLVLAVAVGASVAVWPKDQHGGRTSPDVALPVPAASTGPATPSARSGTGSASASPSRSARASASTGAAASPRPSGSTRRSASPEGAVAGDCTVAWSYQSRQGNGYTATVLVRSRRQVHGWTLTFRLPAGQRVTAGWNGHFSQDGTTVSVRSAGWNDDLTDQGAQVGFTATVGDRDGPGTGFALDGSTCRIA